ncbi:MAG: TetR/AcrR family transcriptional regulator [Cyanobacteria bacterium J06627_28]
MPRPRSFDTDTVIEQLCEYFWTHGYGATSLDEMAKHLGVKRGSLYNAFGSKEVLFNAAFERYEVKLRGAFETPYPGFRAIAHYFNNVITAATTQGMGRGCFYVNLLMSSEIPTPELQKAVERNTQFIRQFLHDHLTQAQREGQLQSSVSVQSAADVLFAAAIAVFALARTKAAPTVIQKFVDNTFRGLLIDEAWLQFEAADFSRSETPCSLSTFT